MPLFGIFCFGIPEFTTYFQISCGTSAYPGGVLFRSCLNHHNIGGQCCHLVNADENPFLYAQCHVMSVTEIIYSRIHIGLSVNIA